VVNVVLSSPAVVTLPPSACIFKVVRALLLVLLVLPLKLAGPVRLCCWFTFCVLEDCVRLRMRCERHPFDRNDGPKEVAGDL